MKLKKLLAALTGAVTALTMCAPLTANATEVKYVFRRTQRDVWTENTDPELLAEGHGYTVSNRCLQGFLAYSEDWTQITELGGMQINTALPESAEEVACRALKPDYLKFRDEFAEDVHVNLPEEYFTDQYRILSPCKPNMPLTDFFTGTEWQLTQKNWQTLLDALEAENSPVTLLGAVYRTTAQQTMFWGDIYIDAEPEFWQETHPQEMLDALKQDGFTGTLTEAYAFCEALAQDPYVNACYPCNELPVSEDSVERTEYALFPVTEFGGGDLDENGRADVLDAVLLARLVGDDTGLEISEQARSNADMNGDGVCGPDDLNLLMRKLALY
ncbi:MAG: dockerin type I repeat-containing protein [Oscillospiraceae bacterium]|nr:dockerin type I repeat-containing protein [Oscillospiraceae bacterium]